MNQLVKQEAERVRQMEKIKEYQLRGSIAAAKFKAEAGFEEQSRLDEQKYAKSIASKLQAADIHDQVKLSKQKMVM